MGMSVRFLLTYSILVVAVTAVYLSGATEALRCAFVTQRTQCGDYACDAATKTCILCRSDADCYPSGMYCQTSTGKCKLQGFFSNFHFSSFVAVAAAICVCAVAVVAGVGGGGILVPMFTALMSVPMKTAVGLSQSTICGQSTLNMFVLVYKKYPDANWVRPLINYQYLSLMLPLGLIGTHIGSILSKFCPDLLRLVLLFVLLSAVLYRTIQKVRTQYAADQEQNQAQVVIEGNNATESPTTAAPTTPETRTHYEQFPSNEIVSCVVCFAITLCFQFFMRVSTCGGFAYWLFVLIPLVILTAMFILYRRHLSYFATTSPEMLMFEWSQKSSVYYPMVAVIAGAGAAMLGIGGGLVLGFVLYEILTPEEASATSGAATFFLSFSSALPQVFSGVLPIDYGIVLFIVGLGATSLGQFVIMDYIKKNGLRYLIVAALAVVAGGSLIMLGGYGIYNAVIVTKNGSSVLTTGHLCGG